MLSRTPLNVDNPAKFSQEIEIPPNKLLEPKSFPLPERKSLDFTVKGLIAEAALNPVRAREARDYLVKRINEANKVVTDCVGSTDGKPTRDAAEIMRRLRQSAASAKGDLAVDLNNLLIAAMASVETQDLTDPGITAKFKVWSYRQLNDEDALCGPTIKAHPNTTLLIPVLNLLDRRELELCGFPLQDPLPVGVSGDLVNLPHGFDVINLHTHGLNVSPSWPADDVFREIHPFQLKFFIYHIPKEHPIGTFWYHPHKHGAVGPQVAGGMAGALLVTGEDGKPSGLDKIAEEKGWGQEQPLILQQLRPYQVKDSPECHPGPQQCVFRPDFFALGRLIQDPGVETIQGIGDLAIWMKKHLVNPSPDLKTLISGRLKPTLAARREGETYRLRLIHAGIEDNWVFGIKRQTGGEAAGTAPLVQVIAWDGIPLADPYQIAADPLVLSPGNRVDILVYFDPGSAGSYEIVDAAQNNISLAQFIVSPGSTDAPRFLKRDDVAQIIKPDPSPAVGGETGFAVNLLRRKRITPNSGTYVLDPGDYKLNEGLFPGKPRHFELNRSARIKIEANAHPIHIHVNPLLLPASDARRDMGLPTGKYWTDTVFVDALETIGIMPFENWTGRTVVHCHILDHEDSGMMNIFEIRNPTGVPVAPLPGVFDLTAMPSSALELMKPSWPDVKPGLGQTNGKVVVFAFLPRTGSASQCSHCAISVGTLSNLRGGLSGSPEFRIVVITGPNTEDVPELASTLNLDSEKDVICVDASLKTFQALALIDGNPTYDKTTRRYTFPQSFDSSGKIIHDSDVMHGLFIVDPKGFVVSSRRAFMAEDDTEQLLADIKFAQNVPAALKVNRGSPSPGRGCGCDDDK